MVEAASAPTSDGWRQSRSSGGNGAPAGSSSSSIKAREAIDGLDRGDRGPVAGVRDQYDGPVPDGTAPAQTDGVTRVELTSTSIDAGALGRWATTPDAGAVVVFSGTVRDHAPGRSGVTSLTYEAYDGVAEARMTEVVDDVRLRWPDVRRVAAVHRTGTLAVGEVAVVVAVSAPHRGSAFEAAAHTIDTLKATVPLWKKETWADGEEWGTDARPIGEVRPAHRRGDTAEVGGR